MLLDDLSAGLLKALGLVAVETGRLDGFFDIPEGALLMASGSGNFLNSAGVTMFTRTSVH